MNSDARLLALDAVQVGMTLSNDLFDMHGSLILGRGAIVTAAILLSLQRRGIAVLSIVPEAGEESERNADIERQRQRLAKLFRRCGDGAADRLLLQYVTQYRLEGWHE